MDYHSLIEVAAVVATVLNVYLTARNHIACWIWGIASVVLYTIVFYSASLYSSMALQVVFYLPMQFIGWRAWNNGGPPLSNQLAVTTLSPSGRILAAAAILPLTVGLGWLMGALSAHQPYADAFVTALSIVAQVLLTRKYVENWLLWIAVDVVYLIYLLPPERLYATMALNGLLLLLAINGLMGWIRLAKQRPEAVPPLRRSF